MTRDAAREAEEHVREIAELHRGRVALLQTPEYASCRGVSGEIAASQAVVDAFDALLAEIAELRRALEWRPIDTAPRDGTEVLLLRWGMPCNHWVMSHARWQERQQGWFSASSGQLIGGDPWLQGWAPLPPLPTPPAGGAHG